MKMQTLAATTVATVAGFSLAASAGTITFDLTGVESWGWLGDPANYRLNLDDIAVGESILSITWDNVIGDGFGPTYGSEMAFMVFEGVNQIGYLNFFPNDNEETAGQVWGPASGGIDTTPFDITNTGDGLSLEFFELYDDGSGSDAVYLSGTVTVNYGVIPAPGALALLGLAGIAGRRRRRRA